MEKLQLVVLRHSLDPAEARSSLDLTLARLRDLDRQIASTQDTLRATETQNSNNRERLDEARVRQLCLVDFISFIIKSIQ